MRRLLDSRAFKPNTIGYRQKSQNCLAKLPLSVFSFGVVVQLLEVAGEQTFLRASTEHDCFLR